MVSKTKQKESDAMRKRKVVTSLYYYSDLSVRNIAQQVDLPIREVKVMIDSLTKSDSTRLLAEQAKTRVDKIMSVDVACLDHSKTASDAASLMTSKEVGSVIVTVKNRPFGIVTERDLVRRIGKGDIYFRDVLLKDFVSYPLITADVQDTVEDAAQIMLKNRIRKLPIVKKEKDNTSLVGIVTVTDLAKLLSPTRRPGLHYLF